MTNSKVVPLLLLLTALTVATAFEVLTPPPKNPNRDPNTETAEDRGAYVNPINRRIINGSRQVHVRRFAELPRFRKKSSRMVSIVNHGQHLYVTTSTSGGYVYQIDMQGKVKLWFDVATQLFAETGRQLNCTSAQHGGLRGIAFPPDHDTTGLFYVSLMEDRPANSSAFRYLSGPAQSLFADSVVIEWRYDFVEGKVIKGSYRDVLRIGMTVRDHPIKQITFAGKLLLIGHGDASKQSAVGGGGMGNDGLGKVLRINPKRLGKAPYRVPTSNPFVNNPKYKSEIYALGFRNPHTLCYSAKHGLFVADAGRDNAEEINIVKAGGNYGWPKREGTFKHLARGGTGFNIGVTNLPRDDAKYGYLYPNAEVGHLAPPGKAYFGQAIAGGCPVENKSPLRGVYFYANFPEGGQLYYSFLGQMKRAVVKGPPDTLDPARVYQAKIYFDHDRNKLTPPLVLEDLREVVRADGLPNARRVDMRFGRGPQGEVYWSSKTNGRIYLVTSSLPDAKI